MSANRGGCDVSKSGFKGLSNNAQIRAELLHQIGVIHKVYEKDSATQGGLVEYRRFPMISVAVR
jgi:hypothetical protein